MKKRNLLFFAMFFLLSSHVYAQEIVNGSFELLSQKSVSRNWMIELGKSSYNVDVDSNEKCSGKYALCLEDTSLVDNDVKKEAIIANTFGMSSSEKVFTIELHAWIKYSNASDSTIALFIQTPRGDRIIRSFASNTQQKGHQWQQIKLSFEADNKSPWYGFYYGFEISAKGKVWMDNVEISVNGTKINDPEGFNFEPTAKNMKWVNNNLSPLRMAGNDESQRDLIPIGEFVSDSKIVALGEPTHGTHEALKFKLRTIQYLVLKKGFTTIALEEVIPTCDIMNKVINTDNPPIKDSLMSLPFYKLYKTAEMVETLQWLSAYNRKNPYKRVKFVGIDMEDIYIKTSRGLLRDYGKQHNPAIYAAVNKIDVHLDSLLKINRTKEGEMTNAADILKADFKDLHVLLRHEVKGIGSEQVLFNLTTYLKVCEQWLESRFYADNDDRDKFMAENIKFYLENFPKEKLIIWAHNFHVANQPNKVHKTMGTYLKEFYKRDIVSIGFTSSQGYYTAAHDYSQKKWGVFAFEKAYKGTYEYILAKASHDTYFLPLNQVDNHTSEASWLKMPMKHLDNGYVKVGKDDDYKFYGDLNSVFDGIVFYKETTGTHSYLID